MSKFKKIAMKGKLQKNIDGKLQANPLVKKDVLKLALVLLWYLVFFFGAPPFLLTLDIACTDQSLAVSRIAEH
jgi:hypothetical protein